MDPSTSAMAQAAHTADQPAKSDQVGHHQHDALLALPVLLLLRLSELRPAKGGPLAVG